MAHLAEILIKVKEVLKTNTNAMADYLDIPPTTYRSYENQDRNPKHEFHKSFKTKFNIDLERSMSEGKICFFDSGEDADVKFKAAMADFHYHIPVYSNISVHEINYEKHTPTAFIICPGNKAGSVCVKIEEQFIICRKIINEPIASGKKYLVVMEDGQEKILTSKHIDKEIAKSIFVITKILSEEQMINRKIENLF